MELTVLVDNTRLSDRPDLAVERGFSLHIKTMGQQVLFDAGCGDTFCRNAKLLDINIDEIDAAVISHYHHDHANGVVHFLVNNANAPIYFRKCELTNYCFKTFSFKRNVGMDEAVLKRGQGRLKFVDDTVEVLPNVYVVTKMVDRHDQPKGNQYLFTHSEQGYVADRFEHEQLLVIKEQDGLSVFTGCAHHGVLNMIDTAIALFPNTRIKAVVGGFHLVGLPVFNGLGGTKQDVIALAQALQQYPIDKFYTGHCTGRKAYELLKSVLGERLEPLSTGFNVEV